MSDVPNSEPRVDLVRSRTTLANYRTALALSRLFGAAPYGGGSKLPEGATVKSLGSSFVRRCPLRDRLAG